MRPSKRSADVEPHESMTASVPSWGARSAFGEGTTLAGHEVVPAALVIFGFGGGGGSGSWPDKGSGLEGRGPGQARARGAAEVAVATSCRSARTSVARTGSRFRQTR